MVVISVCYFKCIPASSLDQGSLCPINQLFCLSRQALHRPPPPPMKEHRLSPMREEQSSAPVNEEGSQNVGAGAAGGCPPGTVGNTGSNKKPRSRTKVQYFIIHSPLGPSFWHMGQLLLIHFLYVSSLCILDFPGGLGYPAKLHPGCWPVPRPGGHSHLVSTT